MPAPVVLVTIEHSGRTWRLASIQCDVQDESGQWHHYLGRLGPSDVYREAGLPGESIRPSRIDLEAILPGDLAAISSEGESPSALEAEIALWRQGDPLERREVIQRGRVTMQSWGSATEAARFSVAPADPADDTAVWPPATWRINDDTWNTVGDRDHDEDAVGGRVYPTPIGRAGLARKRAGYTTVPAVPAYQVKAREPEVEARRTPFHGAGGQIVAGGPALGPWPNPAQSVHLIAGGWVWPQWDAARSAYLVRLHDSLGVSALCYLYHATDGLGQVVALAGDEYAGPPVLTKTAEMWASFDDGSLPNETRDGPMVGAGQILRWCLERSSVEVDWRRTGSASRLLDQYRLAGYWDEPCSPWDWIADNLLPLLPVGIVSGPDGIYPVIWRLDATEADAALHLVDGLDCTIEDEPQQEGEDEILSSAQVEYATSIRTDVSYQRSRVAPSAVPGTARDTPTLHARRASVEWDGAGDRVETETTDLLCDDAATADAVVLWRTLLHSGPRTVLHVVSDGLHHRSGFARLEPGDVVTITSSRYSLSRRVAHVVRAGWSGALCYADLVILPAP